MRTLLSIPLLFLASACGAGPTGPASGPPGLELDREQLTLTRIGESAAVTARSEGRATSTPALSLEGESRWLHELPVLDAAALSAGELRAAAPGSATVRVEAFGGAATLRVHVRPARPLVLSAAPGPVGDGDTLRVRGYGLGEAAVDGVTVGGTRAVVVGRDSATLRLTLPSLPAGECASGAARQELRVSGAEVLPGLTVARRRRGELDLGVGEAAPVPAGCLRLAAHPGARYALAFLDTRAIDHARAGHAGAAPASAYTVAVAEAGSPSPGVSPALLPRPSAAAHGPRRSASPAVDGADPTTRSTPWREGDRFQVRDPALPAPVWARVVRVHGGHLVLAAAEGEAAEGGTVGWLARADSALAQVAAHGYPLLRGTLSSTLPVTSTGSGQLLVLAARSGSPALGMSATVSRGGRPLSYVLLNTTFGATAAGLLRTLAHELAHAWQAEHAREAGITEAPDAWAVEGTAELLAWTVVAAARGIDPLGNGAWIEQVADPRLAPYALLAANTRGDFSRGYESGASFLLDLAARRVRRGARLEDALAAVARGALEGWYGGGAAQGLVRSMRGAGHPGWEPADALLTWTLSQAVDDLTASAELQNPAFRAVSTAGRGTAVGWLPPVVLRSGGRAVREDPAAPAAVSGNAATLTWRHGSPNYFLVEDEGYGGAYTLAASAGGAPLGAVRWMIVRYR